MEINGFLLIMLFFSILVLVLEVSGGFVFYLEGLFLELFLGDLVLLEIESDLGMLEVLESKLS